MSDDFKDTKKLPEYEKDFRKLLKRFRTLEDDIEIFVNTQLKLFHKLQIDNRGIFQIPGLGFDYPKIYKAKKFACKSLKGRGVNSGIRIVYAYYEQEDTIEFIEIYFKADHVSEDKRRIIENYKK